MGPFIFLKNVCLFFIGTVLIFLVNPQNEIIEIDQFTKYMIFPIWLGYNLCKTLAEYETLNELKNKTTNLNEN